MSTRPSIRRGAKAVVRGGSSAVIRAVGIDATDELPRRSCLVVAPHPDDETLGCGATIARMRAIGTDVRVVFLTGGDSSPAPRPMSVDELIALRRAEADRALAALGVAASAVIHWDFPDGALALHAARLEHDLAELIVGVAAEQVLVTSIHDRHPDHAAAGLAARAALARGGVGPTLYEFPIWQRVPALAMNRQLLRSGVAGKTAPRGVGRPRLVRGGSFATAKRDALDEYKSQLPHFPEGFVRDFEQRYEPFWQPREL